MSFGPKEDAYDEEMAPLVAKLIALCKQNSVSVFMHFELDAYEDDDGEEHSCMCTSSIPIGSRDDPGNIRIGEMMAVSRTGPTFVVMALASDQREEGESNG